MTSLELLDLRLKIEAAMHYIEAHTPARAHECLVKAREELLREERRAAAEDRTVLGGHRLPPGNAFPTSLE